MTILGRGCRADFRSHSGHADPISPTVANDGEPPHRRNTPILATMGKPRGTSKSPKTSEDNEDPGNKNVEYYFNLKFDNEIEESYYCEALKTNVGPNKTKDIFSDNTFKCPDKTQERKNVNIYNTDVTEDDIESC